MVKWWIMIFVAVLGLVIGLLVGEFKYSREMKEINTKLARKYISNNEYIESMQQLFDLLDRKESLVNELKVENEKIRARLGNVEKQFDQIVKSLIKTESGKEKMLAETANKEILEKEITEKSTPDSIITGINNAIENKEIMKAVKLLRELVSYGKEQFSLIYETAKKINAIISKGSREPLDIFERKSFAMLKEFSSEEFINFHKWVIESFDTDTEFKSISITCLGMMWNNDIENYFFEQFKSQKDTNIRIEIFKWLYDMNEPKYRGEFFNIAKNFSENKEIRSRIVYYYMKDGSLEVQGLFNFLKANETDSSIKSLVDSYFNSSSSSK